MSTSSLRTAISAHPHVPALDAGVAAVLGAASLSEVPEGLVQGHHIVSAETSISVYVISTAAFGLYEATADGRRLSVSIPQAKWRRSSLYEDPNGAQLTLEFDADRSSVTGTLNAQGELAAGIDCAVYTLVENQATAIESLKALARGFNSALSG